jgi:hypothetical protein
VKQRDEARIQFEVVRLGLRVLREQQPSIEDREYIDHLLDLLHKGIAEYERDLLEDKGHNDDSTGDDPL